MYMCFRSVWYSDPVCFFSKVLPEIHDTHDHSTKGKDSTDDGHDHDPSMMVKTAATMSDHHAETSDVGFGSKISPKYKKMQEAA